MATEDARSKEADFEFLSPTNCEDLAKFVKNQGHKQDSELKENRQPLFLAGEFYRNNRTLQEELEGRLSHFS